jgi:DtxR family Mn-dependent transcriptional regulator
MPDPLVLLLILIGFLAASWWLFWPQRGLIWTWQRSRKERERVLREDALKHIHKLEIQDRYATLQSLAGALEISINEVGELLAELGSKDLIYVSGDTFRLTPLGRDYALQIIRAHRLWERYLADSTGFTEEEWHDQAEHFEHQLTREDLDQLSARLGNPTHDPHGDPIPTSKGEVVYEERIPLPALPLDQPARIVHIEDEPDAIYAQLVAEGLHVGMCLRVTDSTPERIRFWTEGNEEHTLAPILAANIAVKPIPEQPAEDEVGEKLSALRPGEVGEVLSITPRIRGVERRRLMDLGVLPGTEIQAEMTSPSGNPVAYKIRGALIALRIDQAEHIRMKRVR